MRLGKLYKGYIIKFLSIYPNDFFHSQSETIYMTELLPIILKMCGRLFCFAYISITKFDYIIARGMADFNPL
jgi:hypothetical protein